MADEIFAFLHLEGIEGEAEDPNSVNTLRSSPSDGAPQQQFLLAGQPADFPKQGAAP